MPHKPDTHATCVAVSVASVACYTATYSCDESPDIEHRHQPRRNTDRHSGRNNRVNAPDGLALAKFAIAGRVHFDSAINGRHLQHGVTVVPQLTLFDKTLHHVNGRRKIFEPLSERDQLDTASDYA
jgi:hypothetical protein